MNILVEKLNTYSLYLLVFSVTFENWDPFKLVGTYSVTYLASILYLASWIPLLKKNYNIARIKRYVIPLLLFIFFGLLATALNSRYALELKDAYNYRVLLLIILMSFIANHIYKDIKLHSKIQNIYIASILLMFLLAILGQGTEYEKGRLMLFGENPNMIGMKAVIAFLIIAANAIDSNFSIKRLIISIIISIPLLSLVILTASRGAFISVFLGMGILIFFKKTGYVKKLLLTVITVMLSIYFFTYVMENNVALQSRLMYSLETGDTGRNDLWEGAFQVIENNFFIGVGFPGVLPEMLRYSGRYIDPHNVFLYVWMSTGVIGFFFFMLFLGKLMKDLFKTYQITGKTIYMVIFSIILFNMAKAGGGIGKILFWFFFAFLIGSNAVQSFAIKDEIVEN